MRKGHNLTVVHIATELSGGAGAFVRNLHIAMQGMGLPSLVLTRDRDSLQDVNTIKPMSRIWASFRAHGLNLVSKLGLLNNSYAMFGIEKCPAGPQDIQQAIQDIIPAAFIFYWTSYFIGFDTMLALRRNHPEVPIILTCTDEAFLTGGCHYSHGCEGYMKSCENCPGTKLDWLQRRISRSLIQKKSLLEQINPIVIYPTTNLQKMGSLSSALKSAQSLVIPLGAISNMEQNCFQSRRAQPHDKHADCPKKLTVLVRSSSEHRKGCDLLVSALKILKQHTPDLRNRLAIVSIGDTTLSSSGIDQYVDHEPLGYVDRVTLLATYEKIDAMLVTSREDAGPLMINECVALGIFVISTPVGVAKDLIISEQIGQITKGLNDEAIAQALCDFTESFASNKQSSQSEFDRTTQQSMLSFEGYATTLLHAIRKAGELH